MRGLTLGEGQKFGRLSVIRRDGVMGSQIAWLCRCDCGDERRYRSRSLRSGLTKSCGCYKRDTARERFTTHGHKSGSRQSPTYQTWRAMRARCLDANNEKYPTYGGRGIAVCERWGDFANFLADMGERPEGLTLDRRDNDGPYAPDNCRWATGKEQRANQRVSQMLEFAGIRAFVTEWSDIVGINPRTIRSRLRSGWSTEQALKFRSPLWGSEGV